MTGETTSPSTGAKTRLPVAGTAKQEWQRFADFIKRPHLPPSIAAGDDATRGTLRMLALDLMIMSVLITILMTIVSLGIELPENLNSSLELNLLTVVLVVVVAPFIEEIVFRSWLTGRPSAVIPILILASAGIGILLLDMSGASGTGGVVLLLGGVIAALIALIGLRRKPAMDLFARAFPVFFWLSALAFAMVHILNYPEEGVFWIVLPLIIPQFVLGTIAGYVRVHYGLLAAVVLHALHNGFALTVAAIAMKAGLD